MPIQIIISLAMLQTLIGPAVWAGAGTLLLILTLETYSAKIVAYYQEKVLKNGDKRVALLREMLLSIQNLKLMALETFFKSKIESSRESQEVELKGFVTWQFLLQALVENAYVSLSIVTLLIYALSQKFQVEGRVLFPAISYLTALFYPIITVPDGVAALLCGLISIDRIETFFKSRKVESSISSILKDDFESSINLTDTTRSVLIQNGNFAWNSFSLSNIYLDITKVSLVAVVGVVGSGKSSLIKAILGEMALRNGSREVFDTIGYCSQEPWIIRGTILENILFGKEMDKYLLEKVLSDCQLNEDLSSFPDGIHTQLGEQVSNIININF